MLPEPNLFEPARAVKRLPSFIDLSGRKFGKWSVIHEHDMKDGEKHGEGTRGERSPEYTIWASMIGRCHNPKNSRYSSYGGRGITVCNEWRASFSSFLADMGRRPEKHSIDRIDNSKGYSPDNCRWATSTQQNRNRRDNNHVEAFGEKHLLVEWSQITGIKEGTIRRRMDRGWAVETALTVGRTK